MVQQFRAAGEELPGLRHLCPTACQGRQNRAREAASGDVAERLKAAVC